MGKRLDLVLLGCVFVLGAAPAHAAWAPHPNPAPPVPTIAVLPSCAPAAGAERQAVEEVVRRSGVSGPIATALVRLSDETGVSAASAAAALKGRTGGAQALPTRARRPLARLVGGRLAERVVALAACIWAGHPAYGLRERVLNDPRVRLYVEGRGDIASARLDQRIPFVIRYLEAAFGSVAISSLITGHRETSGGHESPHAVGRAVDITAVDGVTITGHQGRHSVTVRAVRLLLMLPGRLAPAQIISLLDLDGRTGFHGSFALPDHWNHVHVGY
jgi:hypothetical protein